MTTQSPPSPRAQDKAATAPAIVAEAPAASRAQPAVTPASNSELVRWMFRFAAPVKTLIFLACLYLALWVCAEVLAVRQTGQVVGHIQKIQRSDIAATGGFVAWVRGGDADAVLLRHYIFVLAGLTATLCVLRYLREVANQKMSMEMVFYIREAVYDKLQRVGFGFHDRLSTGQLINRALSDLQNVRQFINSAILVNGEIVL
ncbi:MAG TPA: ABC transporter transmembrane domain-containing protein, partial [Tepidisphaeraceae bacterium]|nr:ABC transporter transmembrane domain-containing protein [Tepidisphaeraceae bacterium]